MWLTVFVCIFFQIHLIKVFLFFNQQFCQKALTCPWSSSFQVNTSIVCCIVIRIRIRATENLSIKRCVDTVIWRAHDINAFVFATTPVLKKVKNNIIYQFFETNQAKCIWMVLTRWVCLTPLIYRHSCINKMENIVFNELKKQTKKQFCILFPMYRIYFDLPS